MVLLNKQNPMCSLHSTKWILDENETAEWKVAHENKGAP